MMPHVGAVGDARAWSGKEGAGAVSLPRQKKPAKLVAVALANKMAARCLGDPGQGRHLSGANARGA